MIRKIASKDFFKNKFINTDIEDSIDKIKGDRVEMWLGTPEEHKTQEQNKVFHLLLDMYWQSGLSSFEDSFDMRYHYKKISGLIKEEEQKIDPELRDFLLEVYKNMPNVKIKPKLVQLVKNKKIKELSWSNVEKDKARLAIDTLIKDMVSSGYSSKRFDGMMERFHQLW